MDSGNSLKVTASAFGADGACSNSGGSGSAKWFASCEAGGPARFTDTVKGDVVTSGSYVLDVMIF